MKYSYLSSIFIFLYFFSGVINAGNNYLKVIGGSVHLNGKLTEGGCDVFTDSQGMNIDMGQYNSRSFERIGGFSTQSVPFIIKLTDCSASVQSKLGLSFSGMIDPKEPDLFLVKSSDRVLAGASGRKGFSGLGLMISDLKGHQLMPDKLAPTVYKIDDGEVDLHYFARYRAASHSVYPKQLISNIQFNIIYP